VPREVLRQFGDPFCVDRFEGVEDDQRHESLDIVREVPGQGNHEADDLALATHPRYAAPEQLAGDIADERTDVFQLGVVLYELVTGERPFGADHRDRSPDAFELPTPPSELVAVPAPIDDVLGRALASDPDDRYQRALFLRDDLRDLYRSY